MRLRPIPIFAVIALCMSAPVCHAAGASPAASGSPSVSAAAPAKKGARRHWGHWSHYRHGAYAGASGYSHGYSTGAGYHHGYSAGARSGHGHSLRWHTVRDSHGRRHKEWYYADTGEAASGPDDVDSDAVRDLDTPLSHSEQSALHERRVKALDHLAAVEQRVERDRHERDAAAKKRFHHALSENAANAGAHKK